MTEGDLVNEEPNLEILNSLGSGLGNHIRPSRMKNALNVIPITSNFIYFTCRRCTGRCSVTMED